MKKERDNKVVINKFVIISLFLFFIVAIIRLSYLALSVKVDDMNLEKFANNRNTTKNIIYAKRGNIYDNSNNVLAQTVNSYTVIAFLEPSRSTEKTLRHVVDKEDTAKKLSPIINMTEKSILSLLNRKAYQVELGPGGRGITEVTKEKIEELKLPGISFTMSRKRYYPNDTFLSYVLGYVQDKDGVMVGEMGIEQYYNKDLKGIDGSHEFQKDLYGYKLPNTQEIIKPSIDGVDINLTIDNNIQYFVETISKESFETNKPEWLITAVMDAKTGAILGTTSYPTFNPNTKNIKNYLNPLISYTFEPGSTMKIFTYMSVLEKGNYNGKETFKSGSISFSNTKDKIKDWNDVGWGTINYDLGFSLSSNVGVSYLTRNKITGGELRDYFSKLGFGKKTGITLPHEYSGEIDFNYPIEIANAGFGQGITTTPIQMLQAVSSIANDGIMLKPYIIKEITNNENKVVFEGKREEIGEVASKETIEKIKELMFNVVNDFPERTTGTSYKIEGYDIIGKTGTAQYINSKTGRYENGTGRNIRSFIGMFPKDNPEIIIYFAMKDPVTLGSGMASTTKRLIKDISNYKGMYKELTEDQTISNYTMPNLLNESFSSIDILKEKFKNIYVIGDGDKIINQYPNSGIEINALNTIFLITNYKELNIPNLIGLSLKDVNILSNMLKLKLEYVGTGYVYEQELIDKKLIVKLR